MHAEEVVEEIEIYHFEEMELRQHDPLEVVLMHSSKHHLQ